MQLVYFCMWRTAEGDIRKANPSSSFPNPPTFRGRASLPQCILGNRQKWAREKETGKAGELHSLLAGISLSPTIAIHQKQQTVPVTGADTHTLSFPLAVSGRSSLSHCTTFLGQTFSFLTLKWHLRSGLSLSQGTYVCVKAQIFRLTSVPDVSL